MSHSLQHTPHLVCCQALDLTGCEGGVGGSDGLVCLLQPARTKVSATASTKGNLKTRQRAIYVLSYQRCHHVPLHVASCTVTLCVCVRVLTQQRVTHST